MGILFSAIDQSFPPKSKFKVEDIPDLSGKVVIVTGGNTGIGKETAKALLAHNAKVYIAARNKTKVEEAIADLKELTGKEAIFLKLDLADLKSIKVAAEEFQSKESDLHILFNNAGVMACPVDLVTTQGYDMQFGTNVLGHFYFTKLLIPNLLAGAKSSSDKKARVVNTSSSASESPSGLDFNIMKDSPSRKKKMSATLYCQSKLGNVIFSNELAKRYGDQNIISTSLNPGNITSDLQRHLGPVARFLLPIMLYDTPYGALTQLWAGTSPATLDANGKYLIPFARVGKANPAASNAKVGAQLWDWLEEQVKDVQ